MSSNFRISSSPTMPFGKYKGKPLVEVPRTYLQWLQRSCDLHGWLKQAVDMVLTGKPLDSETDEEKVKRIVQPYLPSEGEPMTW